MKISLIPSKKLALLSATFCAAMLAFSQNASAVTNLTLGDGHTLGRVHYLGTNAVSDADETTLVNDIIGLTLNGIQSVNIGGTNYTIQRSSNAFGTLPTAVFALNGTGTNITIGSGIYSYLYAQYIRDGNSTPEVWYIGNLSGDITIPQTEGLFDLVGWTLFTAGGQGVPDGGTTVMLLGAALGALGMARRFLKA